MKQGNESDATRNAQENREQPRNEMNSERDPRTRQWGTTQHQTTSMQYPMSHAPKRDMSGKRRDVND